MWEWSFEGEAGLFITEGVFNDTIAAGTYQVLDFVVSSSSVGATIGALSRGDYSQGSFSTNPPYFLVWDGSSVSNWEFSGGPQMLDWNPYTSTSNPDANYFFGWAEGNIGDVDSAAYWIGGVTQSIGDVSVVPMIPNSGSLALLGIGGLLLCTRRR